MPSTDTKLELTPRILKEAQKQAILFSNRIRTYFQSNQLKSWDDVERLTKVKVPPLYRDRPFTYSNVCGGVDSFCAFWQVSWEARLKSSLTIDESLPSVSQLNNKAVAQKDTTKVGIYKLYPEQEPVFQNLYNSFFPADPKAPFMHAALCPGYPGVGKTVIGVAILWRMNQAGLFDKPPYNFLNHTVMIFCPKTLCEDWRRTIVNAGLSNLLDNVKIVIHGDSLFTSEFGQIYLRDVEDQFTGDITKVWNKIYQPLLVIRDESHRYNSFKAKRTEAIHALVKAVPFARVLDLSATPGETINHMQSFTILCKRNLLGSFITEDNFKYFSQILAPKPAKPNRKAMKRYRQLLQENIFAPPYVKPPHKAINMLELCDFYSPQDKEIYDTAIERYLEACRKGGKKTAFGAFQKAVHLAILRRTIEPLRKEHMAARVAANYRSGDFASAIGVEFKETISSVAFILKDKYNIDRSQMSVIWGGRKEFKQTELIPIQEMERVTNNFPELLKRLDDPLFRKAFANTIRYQQDQYEHGESTDEQSVRHFRLREMRLLGSQSLLKRRVEIDNFQDGTTRICLFTAATGGIGLSLGKHLPSLLPREGFFSLGLSGKVFGQLLGRLVRRNSIADAKQFICAMRDSVEHWFLAPLIDSKLRCTAELTSRDLDIDIEDLMSTYAPAKDFQATDLAEALRRAEEDNTIVSDLGTVKETRDDDEASDEDNEAEDDEIIDKIIDPNGTSKEKDEDE